MECLWRLFCHRQPDGHLCQQDPAVFYVYVHPYDGLPDRSVYDPGFLEKYAEIYVGRQAQSLVLPVKGMVNPVCIIMHS